MSEINLEREPHAPAEPQKQIRAALVKAWGKFPAVVKDRENKGAGGAKYATLDSVIETIKPILAEFELMPSQEITNTQNCVTVRTILIHSSGEIMEFSPVTMPVVGRRLSGGGEGGNGPQEFGSAITYARRYSLLAALGISTGDDDDGHASQPRRHESAHTKGAPKKGSTLKNEIKAKQPELIGEQGAQKLTEYADSLGVTIDQIREHLSGLGANHAKECEKKPEQWPVEWRGTISKFLKGFEAPKAVES